MTSDFILNEYKARQMWERREYSSAMAAAKTAAESAALRNDDAGWWRMMFLYGECQLELGFMDGCAETARLLADHPVAQNAPEASGKAKALMSLGLQGMGLLPEALAVARAAALDSPEAGMGGRGRIEAQQALVAVLSESGHLEDAWHEAQTLAQMVGDEAVLERAGKAYWSIGNVAFLAGMEREGTYYHGLAASSLSPSNDVNLWALFNKASAFMRLTANLVEPETLQCIERAEMALSITGGTRQDELDIEVIRAYWSYLTGDIAAARLQMSAVLDESAALSPLSHGDARLLFARIIADDGDLHASVDHATTSAEIFGKAGAVAREELAKEFGQQVRARAEESAGHASSLGHGAAGQEIDH